MKNQKNIQFIDCFDAHVSSFLDACGCGVHDGMHIGAAVSGGADSTSLLTSLAHICKKNHAFLSVITVDHRIRPDEQSAGDAAFVEEYCKTLERSGFPVDCKVYALLKGQVFSEAEKRGGGIEEAARFLRYEAFDSFISEKSLPFLCLAHNQNDQVETVVMRFLQGSSGIASSGIQAVRGKIVRPLLGTQRCDIERYLHEQDVSWRTDSTNSDTAYLRNRIRNILVPQLNAIFPGWNRAVLSGAQKAFEDGEALEQSALDFTWDGCTKNCVSASVERFACLPPAIIRRLVYHAANKIGFDRRLPYSFVSQCVDLIQNAQKSNQSYAEKKCGVCDIQAVVRDGSFLIEKQKKTATYHGFFAIIKEVGSYEFPFGRLSVDDTGTVSLFGMGEDSLVLERFSLPFCVRSRQLDDKIICADGNMKGVNDVFSSWAVPEKDRDLIPLIVELKTSEQKLLCICGSVLGYSDWIVKT